MRPYRDAEATCRVWPCADGASVPVYRFSVAGHPPGPNDRLCWQARRRLTRPLAEALAWQARAVAVGLTAPLQRAHVTATLVYRRRPFRDADNAVASLKACLDALVTGGLLVSDAPDHLTLEVRQELGAGRGVVLEVRPLPVATDQGERTHAAAGVEGVEGV